MLETIKEKILNYKLAIAKEMLQSNFVEIWDSLKDNEEDNANLAINISKQMHILRGIDTKLIFSFVTSRNKLSESVKEHYANMFSTSTVSATSESKVTIDKGSDPLNKAEVVKKIEIETEKPKSKVAKATVLVANDTSTVKKSVVKRTRKNKQVKLPEGMYQIISQDNIEGIKVAGKFVPLTKLDKVTTINK